MEILSVIIATAAVTTIVIMLLSRRTRPHEDMLSLVQQAQQQSLGIILEQLSQNRESVERQTGVIHTRVDEASKAVYMMQVKLGELTEGNKHILSMSKGISELQSILQAPKLRGERGEIWLEELLTQVIPRQHIETQYRFKSGEIVDAVVRLRDATILPIDSKFSLENFKRMLSTEGPEAKQYEKLFIADTKRRIDEVAKKYIVPSEGTLGFAFMYVPAENVYYQAFVEDRGGYNLTKYAFDHHVIPVSPNSLYPYLEIVMFGLRGMQIEESVKDIVRGLTDLSGELGRFDEEYRKVGLHLKNAQGSFDSSDKRLGKLQTKLSSISNKEIETAQVLELPD